MRLLNNDKLTHQHFFAILIIRTDYVCTWEDLYVFYSFCSQKWFFQMHTPTEKNLPNKKIFYPLHSIFSYEFVIYFLYETVSKLEVLDHFTLLNWSFYGLKTIKSLLKKYNLLSGIQNTDVFKMLVLAAISSHVISRFSLQDCVHCGNISIIITL